MRGCAFVAPLVVAAMPSIRAGLAQDAGGRGPRRPGSVSRRSLTVLAVVLGMAFPGGADDPETRLAASDAAASDFFGGSVAISGDTVLVAAENDSAYAFTRSGGVWTQQQKLGPSDAPAGGGFGWSVALGGDIAVVGAPGDDDGGTDSGSAYAFARADGVWTQQAKLTATDAGAGDFLGGSVAVSGDTAVAGAYKDDGGGSRRGSACVFTRTGGVWTQQARVAASDAEDYDEFGFSVAVSGDTVVVGAWQGGSAYVFTRTDGVWTQQAKLTAAEATGNFGVSVACSGDTAVVGSDGDDGHGTAYVFTRSGAAWAQQAKLAASDAGVGDGFGVSVGLDGDTVLVGADNDDDGGTDSGAGYVFTRSGGVWTQQTKVAASDAAAFDRFGVSAALSAGTVVVGAPYDDTVGGTNSGSAWVFSGLGSGSPAPVIVEPPPFLAGLWRPLQVTLARTGGTPPFTWSVSGGALPTGAVLGTGTGIISGTTTAVGRFDASVRVRDDLGAVSDEIAVVVEVAPVLDLAGGKLGMASGSRILGALELCAGTSLTAKVRFPAGSLGAGALRVLGPSGTAVDLSAALKATARSLLVRNLAVPATGRYFLDVQPPEGFQGELVLSVKVKAPRKASSQGSVSAGSPLTATLATLPGAKVTLQVRAAEESDAVPTILGVQASDGNELMVPGELKEGGSSATLKMMTPVPGRDLTVQFGAREGSSGPIQWKARIREPRGYAFSLPDVPSGDP